MFSDNFKVIPELETSKLLLRAFRLEDIPSYMKEFKNPNVQRHLGGVLILKNEKDASNWLQNINDKLLKRKLVFTWIIVKKENPQTGVGRIDLGGFENRKSAEISYYIWEKHWGNGYAHEAIERVVKFGFENLELARIQAVISAQNINSEKAIMKSGFRKEGQLRNYPLGKSIRDCNIYSITDSDYYTQI